MALSKRNWLIIIVIIGAGILYFGSSSFSNKVPIESDADLDFLTVPEDYAILAFAKDLKDPRVITFDSKGRMLVSQTSEGNIIVLEDNNGDGRADSKRVLIEGLNNPHGLAFYEDKQGTQYLYVAETAQVARYLYDAEKGDLISKDGENIANLPKGGEHFTRTIIFGPNYRENPILSGGGYERMTLNPEKLYISVGSSCNVCLEGNEWKYASVLESDPEGNFTAKLATGLRNAVFMALHPKTGQLWAGDMGRDGLGKDIPPDEINIVHPNKHYGWPFCYGNQIEDKTFKKRSGNPKYDIDCADSESAYIELPAHSSPLGLAFITDKKWSKDWRDGLLIAEHGSADKSLGRGYKVVRIDLDNGGNVQGEPQNFITGWLAEDGTIRGRPVDLKFGPGHALYISDDEAGIIYKVVRK